MKRSLDVATSLALSVVRLGAGMNVGPLGDRPEKPLELYEFEACPFCRKVREALSFLDLDAVVYPCPKNGSRFRPVVEQEGGKAQFPYLRDPNTGTALYESGEIVRYLFSMYGKGTVPFLYKNDVTSLAAGAIGLSLRPGTGNQALPSRSPERMLELYSFEASPYCRIVREVLCSLEIPYVLHNVAKGSPGRNAFVERSGRMMVPWLVDANTDTQLFESADIKEYLLSTYAQGGSSVDP